MIYSAAALPEEEDGPDSEPAAGEVFEGHFQHGARHGAARHEN